MDYGDRQSPLGRSRAERRWPPEGEDAWLEGHLEVESPRGDLRSNFGDPRSPWRRDRDRIYYSPSFHRLSDVTQILHSDPKFARLHNRLTHSLMVAQLAGSLAERFGDWQFADPNVCEAGGLAHDLGHPPYGHLGEATLDELLVDRGVCGYEGNAQAFRVVTKIAVHSPIRPGLDFTRASLAALLKYPHLRSEIPERSIRGVYPSEAADFNFALGAAGAAGILTPEAKIVEWADDISYALHDLDDFYRAGVVRIDEFLACDVDALINAAENRTGEVGSVDRRHWVDAFEYLSAIFASPENGRLLRTFEGDRLQQGLLRAVTSRLISEWLDSIERFRDDVVIDPGVESQIGLIKEFVYQVVIAQRTETARTQQRERLRIQRLFEALEAWIKTETWGRLPNGLRFALSVGLEEADPSETGSLMPRAIADFVGQLTESEAEYWERELV